MNTFFARKLTVKKTKNRKNEAVPTVYICTHIHRHMHCACDICNAHNTRGRAIVQVKNICTLMIQMTELSDSVGRCCERSAFLYIVVQSVGAIVGAALLKGLSPDGNAREQVLSLNSSL